jgi:hypothetical protein
MEMAGMADMTEVEVINGMEVMTGINDVRKDGRALI